MKTAEPRDVERIAAEYRADGYAVVTPESGQVPPFLNGHRPALIATRGTESAVVAVYVNGSAWRADAHALELAELTNAQPGWRFDLVILERDNPVNRFVENAKEPTDGEFHAMIDRARRAARSGLTDMALVSAWGALEAAMRRLRDDGELSGRPTPMQLLSTLYGNGLLTRDDFDFARQTWTARTQAAHGFIPPAVEPAAVENLLALATKLMGRPQFEAAGVG